MDSKLKKEIEDIVDERISKLLRGAGKLIEAEVKNSQKKGSG